MLERPPPEQPADDRKALRQARNRRHRERLRKRKLTFTAEIDAIGIAWLVTHGCLSEHEASDPRTLRAGIGRAVTTLIKMSSR